MKAQHSLGYDSLKRALGNAFDSLSPPVELLGKPGSIVFQKWQIGGAQNTCFRI